MGTPLLEMKNIVKEFPGVKALNNVNIKVFEGEVHAIVGENGAGKSTLMSVLSGIYPYKSYDGDIIFEGEECKFHNIKDSEKKGIVIIHQELALIPYLTIGENMFIGNEKGSTLNIHWDETYQEAEKNLKLVGLEESPRTLIKDIGVGKQQLVEIAKALSKNVKLLILDEPTASLNETDSQKLLDLILGLKKKGISSIIISHKLNEISYIADQITVIRDGKTIETLVKGIDDFSEDRIIKGMVGRSLDDRFPKRVPKIGKVVLSVADWTVHHEVVTEHKTCDGVHLNIRKGEIVGVSGLMGSGRTELAMSIFGKSYGSSVSGKLILKGKEVQLQNPKDAIRHGIAYVTEDRKGNGLILSNSIKTNTTLANLEGVSQYNVIDTDKEYMVSEEYREKLRTKSSSVEQKVVNLSGGNQQKVLLSKWMFTEPDVLILDEPTRGIDVGAKFEIYSIMNSLVNEGKSILMISSDLPEILGMCDRIYVMNEGKIVAELDKEEASQEKIMASIIQTKGV